MSFPRGLQKKITAKYGNLIDLNERPEILGDIVAELGKMLQPEGFDTNGGAVSPPFGVSWMDSWVAHWVYNESLQAAKMHDKELATILRSLVDLKFNERLNEIRQFIRDYPRFDEPPDGGPPEPGAPPPAGPVRFAPSVGGASVADSSFAGLAGTLEEPPDGGPPEPGAPPTGPDEGFLHENPWILYWFVSIRAPLLLNVIDAHITRRVNDLRGTMTGA